MAIITIDHREFYDENLSTYFKSGKDKDFKCKVKTVYADEDQTNSDTPEIESLSFSINGPSPGIFSIKIGLSERSYVER